MQCEICQVEVGQRFTMCCWCDRAICDTCLSTQHYRDEACFECDATDKRINRVTGAKVILETEGIV